MFDVCRFIKRRFAPVHGIDDDDGSLISVMIGQYKQNRKIGVLCPR
jgi:hypothetical protein